MTRPKRPWTGECACEKQTPTPARKRMRVRVPVLVDVDLLLRIDAFRARLSIKPSRAALINHMIRLGLASIPSSGNVEGGRPCR
jgi:hypothetical protein